MRKKSEGIGFVLQDGVVEKVVLSQECLANANAKMQSLKEKQKDKKSVGCERKQEEKSKPVFTPVNMAKIRGVKAGNPKVRIISAEYLALKKKKAQKDALGVQKKRKQEKAINRKKREERRLARIAKGTESLKDLTVIYG